MFTHLVKQWTGTPDGDLATTVCGLSTMDLETVSDDLDETYCCPTCSAHLYCEHGEPSAHHCQRCQDEDRTPKGFNPEGDAICQHRDMSVCAGCATDERYVEVAGVFFWIPDADERAAIRSELAGVA